MDLGLKDRVALVAASSTGLGKAVALGLAREGAKLALCARTPATLEAAAEGSRGGRRTGKEPGQRIAERRRFQIRLGGAGRNEARFVLAFEAVDKRQRQRPIHAIAQIGIEYDADRLRSS